MKFDTVVVGAGPGGSMAAKTLAEGGASVLVLEKDQEIGCPKRCAEGINTKALARVGLTPDPRWALNEIRGATIYAASGKHVDVSFNNQTGYILERKIFEKHLAADAVRAGAQYMVKTTALSVVKKEGVIAGVFAEHFGREFKVECNLVVAADGVESRIAASAGMQTRNNLTDYHSGFQYEMAGVSAREDVLHIFFGDSIAPKGYVWIFPKGDGIANVGIGILGTESDDGRRARDLLDAFIKNNPRFFRGASPIEINAGGIPVSAGLSSFVLDNLMVVGDAAQQVNPIHGGGIAIALYAGKIAGEVGAKAIREGDVSRRRLLEYERIFRETEGVKLSRLFKFRGFLEKLSDSDFEKLASVFTGEDITRLTAGDFSRLPKLLVKTPRLLPLTKKLL